MPLTACPECRHVAAVRSEQLGHRTRCPNCAQTFRPERMGMSFHRLFRAGHVGGAWVGTIFLVTGLILVGEVALASGGWRVVMLEGLSTRLALNAAAVCLVLGGLLLARHVHAVTRRPQPIGPRRPMGIGTTGPGHESKHT